MLHAVELLCVLRAVEVNFRAIRLGRIKADVCQPPTAGAACNGRSAKNSAKFGSFSAVSAPIFARKYALFSIFLDLRDCLADILQFGRILQMFARFAKKCFAEISRKSLVL